MSEADVNIDTDYVLTLDLSLDLLTEMGSASAYYDFSQLSAGQIEGQHQELLDRLKSAILITQDEAIIPLELVSIVPASQSPLSDFENNFDWPMTDFQLKAQLSSAAPIRIKFQTNFVFEEPIALNMYSSLSGKRKSRWLVAGQSGPLFELNPDAAISGEPILADPSERLSLSTLWDYVRFGFVHILPSGWDHLLFLLMVYLSATSTKQLIGRITLFTLAHSLTLGLASYRIIELPGLLIETLISLSILVVALSALFKKSASTKPESWRRNITGSLVIFAFGLLHGLGFASVLMNLNQPLEHFLISLLSFNIGVELGQLCFLAGLAMIIGRFKNSDFYQAKIVRPLSACTAVIILFWLVQLF